MTPTVTSAKLKIPKQGLFSQTEILVLHMTLCLSLYSKGSLTQKSDKVCDRGPEG